MRSVGMLGLAACLALGAASAPASAAVTFNFTQTGGTPPGALSFSGSLAVTDQASPMASTSSSPMSMAAPPPRHAWMGWFPCPTSSRSREACNAR
jgi:hypothetical protein